MFAGCTGFTDVDHIDDLFDIAPDDPRYAAMLTSARISVVAQPNCSQYSQVSMFGNERSRVRYASRTHLIVYAYLSYQG